MKKLLKVLCKRMIERTYFLYLNGDINADEAEDKRFFWYIISVKWVRGECHHLCCLCDYKYECWSNSKYGDNYYMKIRLNSRYGKMLGKEKK